MMSSICPITVSNNLSDLLDLTNKSVRYVQLKLEQAMAVYVTSHSKSKTKLTHFIKAIMKFICTMKTLSER